MIYSLPDSLLSVLTRHVKHKTLRLAASHVHEKYTICGKDTCLTGTLEPLAYCASRMPATYAALSYVLETLKGHLPGFSPQSMFDIGCGPGTAYFAVREKYPLLQHALCMDYNKPFLDLFALFCQEMKISLPELVCKKAEDVRLKETTCDLAVVSYSLGEMTKCSQKEMISKLCSMASCICVLEPGTPRGYEAIVRARDEALVHGFRVVAPCPHGCSCPMKGRSCWCHVRVRLLRPEFLQRIKGAELGYEDEALCYLILQKNTDKPSSFLGTYARIVETPKKRTGHIHFDVCTPEGSLQSVVVSKRDKDRYVAAKELGWGDLFLK